MLIDAHHHLWDPAHGDYGWLEPESSLCRAFTAADFEPLLADVGVSGTVVVQAAPCVAETERLLQTARGTPWILGVVGWADLSRADAVRPAAGLVGLRPMLQDMPDRDWINRDGQAGGLRAMADAALVFDALVRHDQLDTIATLARAHPALPIVLDHAGKPPFGNPAAMRDWREGIARVADCPNVHCKLSGLLTELPPGASPAPVADSIGELLGLWGPERLIWGSDWPVLTLTGDYASWLALARSRLPESTHSAVFGTNACRLYRLPLPGDRP